MFTGIIQAMGRVACVEKQPAGVRLTVQHTGWEGFNPALGDSVCVSGVCLTVVGFADKTLRFDVVAETLTRSTLGEVAVGRRVNLEPAATPTTSLGGHFVQGHVDGTGRVTDVRDDAGDRRVTVQPSGGDDLMEFVTPKGSVTVEGVSLTVAAVTRAGFEVALIPTTLERTTLGQVKIGDRVNLETDIISRTVVHWLRRRSEGQSQVTMEALRRAGFVGE